MRTTEKNNLCYSYTWCENNLNHFLFTRVERRQTKTWLRIKQTIVYKRIDRAGTGNGLDGQRYQVSFTGLYFRQDRLNKKGQTDFLTRFSTTQRAV